MSNNNSCLRIDISNGGNGDMWMRLVSCYAMAGLLPGLDVGLFVPGFMRGLARHCFGSRLTLVDDPDECTIRFTSLGLRDMLSGFRAGDSFVAPYHRSVIHDRGERTWKDSLNITLHNLGQLAGRIHLPPWECINDYQGYMDIAGIRAFSSVSYPAYLRQLRDDYPGHREQLAEGVVPTSPELKLPADLAESIIVFPNGTSRQFIPDWWATKHLPDAYYAFFHRDDYAEVFLAAGLKVIFYYKEPGDIVALSHAARWTISTDSFSSHLLQFGTERTTITITEVLATRIVAPVFRGKVVQAVAACHPCLKLERKAYRTCMTGHVDCLNWKSDRYTSHILNSIATSWA